MKKHLTKKLFLLALVVLLTFCTLQFVNIMSVYAVQKDEALRVDPVAMSSYTTAYEFLTIEVDKSYWVFPWHWDWDIKLTNTNSFEVSVTYNSRLCHESDAENFTGLNDLSTITIPGAGSGNNSKVVRITHNGNAGFVVAAINAKTENNKRYKYISYVDGLKYENNVGSTHEMKISVVEE